MTKQLKIWGGNGWVKAKQVRMVVIATTKKRAMEISGVKLTEFNGYWCETKSAKETALLVHGESVWYCPDMLLNTEYIRLK